MLTYIKDMPPLALCLGLFFIISALVFLDRFDKWLRK